jgi:hypothetical protein
MLTIHHKSLRSILSPCDMYLWDPSPSDLWDLTAYVSRVPVGPFSISIRPVGPDGLLVTCACGPFSIRLVGPDDTFLHLHLTYGTRRLACHVSDLWDLTSPSNLWDPVACVSCVRLVGPNDTFLHLHPTCGTRWLAVTSCREGLINSN